MRVVGLSFFDSSLHLSCCLGLSILLSFTVYGYSHANRPTSGFFGHIVYADEVAAGIGWPINSGFQMELAFAAIGIGLIGFIGFWDRSFWLPFIIAKTTFMWGAGFTHINHMIQHDNFSPSNTGIVVYWDFLLPVILIVLYILYWREQKTFRRKS